MYGRRQSSWICSTWLLLKTHKHHLTFVKFSPDTTVLKIVQFVNGVWGYCTLFNGEMKSVCSQTSAASVRPNLHTERPMCNPFCLLLWHLFVSHRMSVDYVVGQCSPGLSLASGHADSHHIVKMSLSATHQATLHFTLQRTSSLSDGIKEKLPSFVLSSSLEASPAGGDCFLTTLKKKVMNKEISVDFHKKPDLHIEQTTSICSAHQWERFFFSGRRYNVLPKKLAVVIMTPAILSATKTGGGVFSIGFSQQHIPSQRNSLTTIQLLFLRWNKGGLCCLSVREAEPPQANTPHGWRTVIVYTSIHTIAADMKTGSHE